MTGAARAAEHLAGRLDAVPDHLAPAVLAQRSQPMNRALEAVEDVVVAAVDDLEGLVVLVAAHLTLWHRNLLSRRATARSAARRVPATTNRLGGVRLLDLGPGVAERDGAIEHGPARGGVGIDAEIAR